MCGIVGFTGKKNKKLVSAFLETIRHRGYDDTAYYFSRGINLGMNRFAIIDLSKKLYPMIYKHFVLVFNGEIYNFKELKEKLRKNRVVFKTKCDAEVILPLLDLYGPKAFEKLEGMFAICIFDKNKNRLILARDKSGEKPLYFSRLKSRFAFSSELKTLLEFFPSDLKLHKDSLVEYLIHGSIYGNKTLVKGIYKVPPASYLNYNLGSGKFTLKKYWQPRISDIYNDQDEKNLKEKLAFLISKSVKSRLLADVPVGTFLSGGTDSSLITYFVMQKMNKLRTYSTSFPGFPRYDETRYFRLISQFLGTNHTEIECSARTIKPILENIESLIDEPIDDPAFLPTYLMAKEARKSVKVVLTGAAADELFAGYYRFHKELFAAKLNKIVDPFSVLSKIPRKLIPGRFCGKFIKITTPLEKHYSPLTTWSHEELTSLLKFPFNPTYAVPKEYVGLAKTKPLLTMQLADSQRYLAEQILMKDDKATMLHNLESRAPYLDTRIINFALSLPDSYKIRGIHGKYILRKVAEDFLPNEVAWRLKKGFSLPLGIWFRRELKNFVLDSLEPIKKYDNIFNLPYYEHLVKKHMDKEIDYRDKIWTLSVLARWLNHYKITA